MSVLVLEDIKRRMEFTLLDHPKCLFSRLRLEHLIRTQIASFTPSNPFGSTAAKIFGARMA